MTEKTVAAALLWLYWGAITVVNATHQDHLIRYVASVFIELALGRT